MNIIQHRTNIILFCGIINLTSLCNSFENVVESFTELLSVNFNNRLGVCMKPWKLLLFCSASLSSSKATPFQHPYRTHFPPKHTPQYLNHTHFTFKKTHPCLLSHTLKQKPLTGCWSICQTKQHDLVFLSRHTLWASKTHPLYIKPRPPHPLTPTSLKGC